MHIEISVSKSRHFYAIHPHCQGFGQYVSTYTGRRSIKNALEGVDDVWVTGIHDLPDGALDLSGRIENEPDRVLVISTGCCDFEGNAVYTYMGYDL